MPHRILLIAGFFPPFSPLGAVRAPMLVRWWLDQGHDVRVIALDNPAVVGQLNTVLPPEAVRYIPFESAVPVLDQAAGNIKRLVVGGDGTLPRRWEGLRNLYRQIVHFPDRYRDWIGPAVAAGVAMAKDWRPDFIYSTAPPHSGHIVAQRIAARLGRPWLAELRDLWADNPYNDVHPWFEPVQRLLAWGTLAHAAGHIALTRGAGERISKALKRPVTLSYNGFGADDFVGLDSPAPLDPDRLTIIHAGIIYAGRRDPTALFAALARLDAATRARIRLIFFHDELAAVARGAAELGVSDCVELRAPVPRREILALERAADVLLLCRWADPAEDAIIPGKLFEYIGARRPILAIGSATGEAADIIRADAFGTVLTDPDAIARQLADWLVQKDTNGCRLPDLPAEPTRAYLRETQFRKIDAAIKRVIG
ncbi:MAG: hypothetical protein K2Y20_14165 [Sphingomonas sp.]|nr:hypothetical protein [Sphingomonas sp.]